MFAIDCMKANGSHLGTCIDRFYFGSCCQIPDKTILPQIIGNTIEDNSIDTANFVHPLTIDKFHNNIYKKTTTTEKIDTTSVKPKDTTEPLEMETKSDDSTTIDNKIINDDVNLTTAIIIDTTTKSETKTSETVTEMPIKLSTYQTVSGEGSIVTEAPKETTEATKLTVEPIKLSTESTKLTEETTQTTTTQKLTKPTRKPTRPTYTRPTYKPYNYTRPTISPSTVKPKPTKPTVNKRPSYRPPLKRPTKKPLPSPPRLNITILPQSTSSKPIFTKPSSVSIIYVNTTNVNEEDDTKTTTTTTTETPATEKVTESNEIATETITTAPEVITDKVSESPIIEVSQTEAPIEVATVETDKITEKIPSSSATPTSTSTEFPPLVTWSNTVDSATKEPEKVTEPNEGKIYYISDIKKYL